MLIGIVMVKYLYIDHEGCVVMQTTRANLLFMRFDYQQQLMICASYCTVGDGGGGFGGGIVGGGGGGGGGGDDNDDMMSMILIMIIMMIVMW